MANGTKIIEVDSAIRCEEAIRDRRAQDRRAQDHAAHEDSVHEDTVHEDTVHDRLFVRVERTFAFFDLCGFTTFTDVVGDDEAVDVLNQFRAETRRACWAHHVRIVKWLGDGVMLAASKPRSVIIAAVELSAGMTSLGSPLLMRGGIARGPVVLFEDDDYVGRAVNLAARLSDCATPGSILVTADLAGEAPPWATLQPVAGRVIRGFSGTRNLVAIHGPARPSIEHRARNLSEAAFGAGTEM